MTDRPRPERDITGPFKGITRSTSNKSLGFGRLERFEGMANNDDQVKKEMRRQSPLIFAI